MVVRRERWDMAFLGGGQHLCSWGMVLESMGNVRKGLHDGYTGGWMLLLMVMQVIIVYMHACLHYPSRGC